MLGPFICRKCTARLARPSFRTIPAERLSYSAVLSAQVNTVYEPEFSHAQHSSETLQTHGGEYSAVSLISPTPQQARQDEGSGETVKCWNGEFRRFVPKTRPDIVRLAGLPPPKNARQLKARILSALGEYSILCRDLAKFYLLSPLEARHAAGQLERLLRGHPKIQSAAPRLDQYHVWKKGFSALLQKPVATSPYRADNSSAVSMKTAWQRLDNERRQRLWPAIVLSALDSEPHTLPTLIQSTFDSSWCPSYVVEDVLYILVRRHQHALKDSARGDCGRIRRAIDVIAAFVLRNCPPRYLVLEQTVLHMILSTSPTFKLAQHYQLLRIIQHPLNANTLLHIASRFAKGFSTKVDAVNILHILTDLPGFDLNTPAAASVCSSLLTLNEKEPLPDQNAAPDVLFDFLLSKGFRPNLLKLSALMRNCCIRGHLDTAWKIFELMLQHGLEPDQHVFSILLNGSKQNNDIRSLEQISNIITSRDAWSTILVNDLLDVLFRENEAQQEGRRRQRKKGNNAWRPMLQLYAKFFDLAPLQKFTLFPLEDMLGWGVQLKHRTPSTRLADNLMPRPDDRLMQPDSTTLCLMLSAHMRSILTPGYAIRYYNYFFKLVNRKDPAALRLLEGSGMLPVDILLRNLMQFRSTTGFAIRRFRKMVQAAHREKAKYGRYLYHHPPSVHTWTIMINGLKNHNDMRGAMTILDLMTKFSRIKPTLPTWNAIIQGFARIRNVNGAVEAIRSLEEAGFRPNDRTIKAVRMFPRPLLEKVVARLEKMQLAPERFQETKALLQDPITEPLASQSKWAQGFSSNVPIRHIRPIINKTLDELAQGRERLSLELMYRDRTRRSVTKLSRIPANINSSSPYVGIQMPRQEPNGSMRDIV